MRHRIRGPPPMGERSENSIAPLRRPWYRPFFCILLTLRLWYRPFFCILLIVLGQLLLYPGKTEHALGVDLPAVEPGVIDGDLVKGLPNLNHPFIFFHIPKCAGSTLRAAIHKASIDAGKKILSPCYDSVPCPVTEQKIAEDKGLSSIAACAEVFSGHFTTGLIPTLTTLNKNIVREDQSTCLRKWSSTIGGEQLPPSFECIVALREPISRFVSHFYHFSADKPNFKGRKLTQLSLEEITDVVHSTSNNTMVDYLSRHAMSSSPLSSWEQKIGEAEKVLNHCVIMMTSDWNSSVYLAETAFPWLSGYISSTKARNIATSKHETFHDFSAEVKVALQSMLHADLALYEKAVGLYKKQSQLLRKRSRQGDIKRQIPSSAAAHTHHPAMVKAVTYFCRGNPLNFWDQRFESFIDTDFKKFLNEGFNSIILLVPWSGVQLSVSKPPKYKAFILQRIENVLNKAAQHGLRVIFRVSYPHTFDPANVLAPNDRCRLIMAHNASNGIKDGWLDYMRTLNDIFMKPQFHDTYLYSYFSWEDFFCLLSFSQDAPLDERAALSKHTGFDRYLVNEYTSDQLADLFPEGQIHIPRWDLHEKSFSSYIDFIDSKWWSLVEEARLFHPRLTMEVRVDAEGGIKRYDMHHNDEGPPRQAYWGGYMGARNTILSAQDGLRSLEFIAKHFSNNAQSSAILGQFNFQDNTPRVNHQLPAISLDQCNTFLEASASVLKKYTRGYGLWAYRNYRQSEVFNGSFLLGLEGWDIQKGGRGSIEFEETFLLLSANGVNQFDNSSYAKVEQTVRQLATGNCDNGNNNMELCFRYRMRNKCNGNTVLSIMWDGKKVEEVAVCTNSWNEKCLRLPGLRAHTFYKIGFLVEGEATVNIDNVEMSCHTHNMYMHTVNNTPIPTCFDGIKAMNALLD